jgi:hypothetical protein
MDPAVAVPPYTYITAEIRNSYICPIHTLLVLSAILTIPSITTVYTMLQAIWARWAGPSQDQLPLPVGIPLSVSRNGSVVGRRCVRKNKDPTI